MVASGTVSFAYSTNGKTFKTVGEVFAMHEDKWSGTKVGMAARESAGMTGRGWIDTGWFRVSR